MGPIDRLFLVHAAVISDYSGMYREEHSSCWRLDTAWDGVTRSIVARILVVVGASLYCGVGIFEDSYVAAGSCTLALHCAVTYMSFMYPVRSTEPR